MFVLIHYADNKTEIVNAACKSNIFLQHLRTKCGISHEDVIDVSDEQGVAKHLHSHLDEYAAEYLCDRENLVLLKVERDEQEDGGSGPEAVEYIPLLDGLEENMDFIRQLNPKSKRKEKLKSRKTPSANMGAGGGSNGAIKPAKTPKKLTRHSTSKLAVR